MKTKKIICLAMTMVMICMLAAGIGGGTVYGENTVYYGEDFEGTQFEAGTQIPTGDTKDKLKLTQKSATATNTTATDFTIQQDSDSSGFNKYLQLGRESWFGSASGETMSAVRRNATSGTTAALDLYNDTNRFLAFEFDCKGTGRNYSLRYMSLSRELVKIGGVYINNQGVICGLEWSGKSQVAVSSGVKFDMDRWNHFKLIFNTATKEYDIYYNNSTAPIVRASYDTNYYYGKMSTAGPLTDLKPTGFYAEMILGASTVREENAYADYFGIDNVKVYEAADAVWYSDVKLYTGYDSDSQVDITEAGLAAGEVTAEVEINNLSSESVPVTLIAALYKGDRLVKAESTSESYTTTAAGTPAKIHTPALTVPGDDTSDYKVKVFLWNGTDTLQPLKKATEFTVK